MNFGSGAPAAVPVVIAIAALATAALFWFVGGHTPRVTLLLVILASAGLAGTSFGADLHKTLTNAFASAASDTKAQVTAGGIGLIIAGVLGYVVGVHWVNRQVSYVTLGAAATLPFVAVGDPGVIGRVLLAVVSVVSYTGDTVGHWLGL
jgi:hypothetical protein